MNKKMGMYSSILTLAAVAGFAVAMIAGSGYASYLSSFFISLGFVPMICAFAAFSRREDKALGYAAIAFSAIYAVYIGIVYFAQMTTVQFAELNGQAAGLIDYSKPGSLFFYYDLLGYAFMALATFFTGLTLHPGNKSGKWLKGLLLVHGVFAVSCTLMPMLGVFKAGMTGGDMAGVIVLEFWCAYFIPVSFLSYKYFKRQ